MGESTAAAIAFKATSDQIELNAVKDELTLLDRIKSTVPCLGIIFGLLCGVCFASASFLVKLLNGVDPFLVVISRLVSELKQNHEL